MRCREACVVREEKEEAGRKRRREWKTTYKSIIVFLYVYMVE